jgi:hypothetical protein
MTGDFHDRLSKCRVVHPARIICSVLCGERGTPRTFLFSFLEMCGVQLVPQEEITHE